MTYPEQKTRFGNISLKVILFSTGSFKICEKLTNNSRCKIMSRILSQLNISHVDRTPAIPKG